MEKGPTRKEGSREKALTADAIVGSNILGTSYATIAAILGVLSVEASTSGATPFSLMAATVWAVLLTLKEKKVLALAKTENPMAVAMAASGSTRDVIHTLETPERVGSLEIATPTSSSGALSETD